MGETLLLPNNILRSGEDVFLDDLTLSEVENALQVRINIVESSGQDFLNSVKGIEERRVRDNGNFVYIDAFDRNGNGGKV